MDYICIQTVENIRYFILCFLTLVSFTFMEIFNMRNIVYSHRHHKSREKNVTHRQITYKHVRYRTQFLEPKYTVYN